MNPCLLHYDGAAPLTTICPTCHHPLGSHTYPEGLCISCVNQENVLIAQRLALRVDLQERFDQLMNAHIFLVERLERIENHVAIRGTDATWLAERPDQ